MHQQSPDAYDGRSDGSKITSSSDRKPVMVMVMMIVMVMVTVTVATTASKA